MISELFPAVVFAVCVAVPYLIALEAIVWAARRRRLQGMSFSHRIALILAAAGAVCITYGYFIEPYSLATSRIELRSPKVLPGQRPIRIAHFSDLHSDPRPRLERKLLEAVAAEHPDIIVFTGDAINSPDGLPLMRETVSGLGKIAPAYVVRGNWDTELWYGLNLYGGIGVTELNGDAVRLNIGGTPIWIAGLAFDHASALQKTVRPIPPNEFSVLLYHSPDLMPEVMETNIDLFCAGHTHGGQVALPLYGALITLSKLGKRYEAGLYHEKNTWLYVNRGVGMEGGPAPRVRFWSKPELTVIDIRPAA